MPRVANSGRVRITKASGNALSSAIPVTRQSSSNVFSSVTTAFNSIAVGYSSVPAFTDLDGDGLLDMLVGEIYGSMRHYEQNSANSTSFTLRASNFNNIAVGFENAPTFTDLDGDGLLDMLIGEYNGNINHYEQSAANSTSFTLVTENFSGINVGAGSNSVPTFTDLDGDGLLDLIVGEVDGNLNHYEQSAANSASFTLITSSFNGIDVGRHSTPTITDIDGDGLLDMIVGEEFGALRHYEQIAANSTSFTLITSSFNGIAIGTFTKTAFTDLDGDGLLDFIIGEFDGNLNHYEQNQSPVISTLSANPVCVGSTVSITGTDLTGATSVTINGSSVGTLSGVTSTNITFTVPANATSGNVMVTTPSGTSNAVAITINALPTTPTISGASSICTGGNTTLTTTRTLLANEAYLWSDNSSASSLSISAAGTYSLRIRNSVTGCTSTVSNAIAITVNPLPTTPTISGATTICTGGNTTLTTTRTLLANEAYLWSDNSSASTLLVSAAGTYSLRIRNTVTGCTSSVSNAIAITVNPLPTSPTISGASAICTGGNTTLTTTRTLLANEAYLWSDNSSASSLSISAAGTYSLRIRNTVTGCTSTVSNAIEITVNPLPTSPTIAGATSICSGSSTSLTTTATLGTNEAYLWSNNSSASTLSVSAAGTYSLRIRNTATGCTSAVSNAVAITVNPLPTTPTISGASSICTGGNTTLTTTRTLLANEAYLWSDNSSASTLSVSAVGTYSLRIRNTVTGCTSAVSTSITVTENTIPTTPTIAGATAICEGSSTSLTTTATLGTNEAYLWSDNSSASTLLVSTAGTYSLRIRNTFTGCTSAVSNTITLINTGPTFTSFGSSSTAMDSSLVITGTNLTGTTSVRFGETPALFTVNSNTQITATVPRVANSGKVSLSNDGCSALSTYIPINRQSGASGFSSVTTAFNGIDVGSESSPSFTDLDGDGLLDMIVGEEFGALRHYEQNAANSTNFTLVTANFNSIDIGIYSAPAFTDLDGDGLLDLIVGEYDGNLNHYEQNAVNSTSFTLITSNFNGINVGFYSSPTFTDLDGDGLLDMLIGENNGNLNHYEQSAANSASFTLVTANFNSIGIGFNSAPAFTDLDGDGLLDLIVGEFDGNLNHYEQSTLNSTSFTLITATFNSINVGGGSVGTPTFTDLNGDGLLDMLIGEDNGIIKHYEQNNGPVIANLSANPTCQGSTVSITGTDFTGATLVTINGTDVGSLSGVTATNITFTVPANATSGNVVVTAAIGTSNAVAITIGLPTFTSFGSSSTAMDSSLVITGTDLIGVTSVKFGAIPARFTVNSSTQITATVPRVANSGNVMLSNSGGCNALSTSIPVARQSSSNVFSSVSAAFNGINGGTAPTFTDLDGDGLLDMLVGESNGNIHHYEQNAANSASFTLRTTSFSGIDVGINSVPTFTDLDGDGLLDLIIGEDSGNLNHYEQSSANSTSFALNTENFNLINVGYSSVPTFTDLDGDGLLDLLIGAEYGNIHHYEQNAANSTSFTLVNTNFSGISVGYDSKLTFTDLDGDGLLDMLVGEQDGNLNHYEQNTANSTSFTLRTETFNGIDVGSYSVPAFTDLDGDGLLDMLIGESNGNLNHYEQNAANSTSFTLIIENFNGIDVGDWSTPTFTDLDGDGLLDLIIGEYDGNLNHYKQNNGPIISNLSANLVCPGSTVSITGTDFTGATLVTINGSSVGALSGVTATNITFTVPANATSGNIVVTAPIGTSNSVVLIIDNNPPAFTSFGTSATAMDSSLVITGTDLSGVTSVRFGETPARFTINSSTQITAAVPRVANTGKVSLSNPSGCSAFSTSIPVTRKSSSNLFSSITASFNTIDVGAYSAPTFTDLDGDGLLDMIVGEQNGNLKHYEQSSANSTSFTLITENFNGIDVGNFSTPAFTDLDGDGLLDMIVGEQNGNLNHYEQNAVNSTSFILVTENFNTISVGLENAPTFTDLDGDGLLDMLLGDSDGNLNHYEQNATNSTSFTLVTDNFNSINVGYRSVPTLTDLDGDGLLDMIVGRSNGTLSQYEQNAANSTSFTLRTANFNGINVGAYSSPTFTDLDGDGLLDLLLGDWTGSLKHYEQNPLPIISTLSANSVCRGSSVSITGTFLTGATLVTINGTSVGTLSGVTATNITFTVPANATSGNVVVTTPNGTSNAIVITINPLPTTPTIEGASRFCAGGNIILTTTYSLGINEAYLWSDNSSEGTLLVSAAGTYSLRIRNTATGCTSAVSNGKTITVTALPATPTISGTASFCTGGSTVLTSSIVSGGTYLWNTGATTQNLIVDTIGTYTVRTIYNSCTSLTSAAITISETTDLLTFTSFGSDSTAMDSSLIITGTNLSGVASVKFGATPARFTVNSSTQITATVPRVANSGNVMLSNSGGCSALSASIPVARQSTSNIFSSITTAFNGINVGTWIAPTFTDLDGDGLLDMLTRNNNGYLNHYEQSAANSTSFTLITETFNNLTTGNKPTFTDLDGDGLLDLIVGTGSGTLFHYEQNAVNSTGFTLITSGFNGGIDVGFSSAPAFTDLDGDGLLDMLVGDSGGRLRHYEQIVANSIRFSLITTTFNGIDVGIYSTPTFTDLDGDGLLDMLVGEGDGNINHYEQNTANSTSFTLVTTTFNGISVGTYSAPTFTDLDGDGLLDMLVGEADGNINHFEQNQSPKILTLSANPACIGSTVSITGTDFTGATLVTINDTIVGTLSDVTATNITVTVPANAISGNVVVTTPSGTSNAVALVIGLPTTPTISGSATFCFGTSTVLTSSAATGNIWSNGENTQSITVTTPGTYSVQQISGVCTTSSSESVVTSIIANGTWLGTTSNWNTTTNWCGGVPTASTDITLPITGLLPTITGTTATCRNLTVPVGVSLNIENGANFNLKGSLSGLGSIAGVSGSTLTLSGSTAQTIQRVNVGTLLVNNSAGALLGGNAVVKDGVTLTNGVLNTQTHNLILLNTATSPTETTNSYVVGNIRSTARMVGTGTGSMFGITIAAGTDNLDTVMIERGENAATYNGNEGIGHIWKIRAGNQPVSGRQITLAWNPRADNGKDITRLQVYRRPDTGGEWIRMGGIVNGSLRSISLTTNSFSDWTVSDQDAPLPVTLTSFTGKATQLGNQLNWTTSSEVNNQGFNVERSLDGKIFTKISFVKGFGTTNTKQTYQFTDSQLSEAYYRLQQVDFDGKTEYSAIIKVGENLYSNLLEIYPNPASDKVTVNTTGTGTIEIVNNLGQVLITQPAIGTNEINISKLAMGVYSVKFNGVSQKLVIR